MRIDLHTHTTASDGSDTPSELVRKANRLGLAALAVTDHDTVDGLTEALAAAAGGETEVIPGLELTTDTSTCEVHVLGLYVRHPCPALLARVEAIREERISRAKEMVRKVQELGFPLSWEAVWETASTKGFVGRSQIFRAMKARGMIPPERAGEAFAHFFGKGGLAYVPHRYLEPEEAVRLVRQAGGVPVLAHPGRLMSGAPPDDALIVRLTEAGLMGIEAYYPTHDAGDTMRFLQLADRLGLIVTGGTDYHGRYGATGAALGSCSPPPSALARLREAALGVRRAMGEET